MPGERRKGGAKQASEKLEQPPRRLERHPSSTEEGSHLGRSPPDSGGVARRAPGWLSAAESSSEACLAPPFQKLVRSPGYVRSCCYRELTVIERRAAGAAVDSTYSLTLATTRFWSSIPSCGYMGSETISAAAFSVAGKLPCP